MPDWYFTLIDENEDEVISPGEAIRVIIKMLPDDILDIEATDWEQLRDLFMHVAGPAKTIDLHGKSTWHHSISFSTLIIELEFVME